MHRGILAAFVALFLLGFPLESRAAAYDDFARGVAAFERGDSALAISALTAAIDAGDLATNLKQTAYLDRADAYLREGECAPAKPDLHAALSSGANAFDVDESLGFAEACLGNFGSADAEYSLAIAIRPKAHLFFARGVSRWSAGHFSDAAADFAQVVHAQPKDQYAVLWLTLACTREQAADPGVLAHNAAALDLDIWPGPIVEFLLNRNTREDVIAAAAKGADAQIIANQQCEADFYIAEWSLAYGTGVEAKPLLQRATASCPHDLVEWREAAVELARLP